MLHVHVIKLSSQKHILLAVMRKHFHLKCFWHPKIFQMSMTKKSTFGFNHGLVLKSVEKTLLVTNC